MKSIKGHFLPLFLIILAIGIVFHALPYAYFEQDEWHSFGHYIYLMSLPINEFVINALQSGPFAHFTPLSLFFKMSLYKLFELKAQYYFIVSIVGHTLVTIAVYFLVFRLLKKTLPAFIGAVFFAVNSSHYQAVTWLGNFEGTQGAAFFGTLALIAFTRFLEGLRKLHLLLSVFLIFVALLFKETALAFAAVLGTWIILTGSKIERIKRLSYLAGILLVYFLLRSSYVVLGTSPRPSILEQTTLSFKETFLYNISTLPVKIFAQIIIPHELLARGETIFTFLPAITEVLQLGGISTYDFLIMLVGGLILVAMILLGRSGSSFRSILLGLLLVELSLLPLLAIKKRIEFLDSRFLYISTVGISLAIAAIYSSGVRKKIHFTRLILSAILVVVVGLHVGFLGTTIYESVERGDERHNILKNIKQAKPNLPPRVIFYTESDKTFYGLPPDQRILPFQSGVGQTILVLYQPTEKFPKEFFKDDFLWDITDQGYREVNDRGFGYFRDFEIMTNIVHENRLSIDSVIAYRYDSQSKSVEDATDEVRGRVEGALATKSEITAREITVTPSLNTREASLMLDGRRETFWDSHLPYAQPQFVEIDLGRNREVAQVAIDSYNNKNQNEVGYAVFVSEDRLAWRQVFFAKRYPPQQSGIISLYFRPVPARYIKIEQIGFHKFASWVIHEIKLYETID